MIRLQSQLKEEKLKAKRKTLTTFVRCVAVNLKIKFGNFQKSTNYGKLIKKSLNSSESTPSNATNKENMPLYVNQETIAPRVSHFLQS